MTPTQINIPLANVSAIRLLSSHVLLHARGLGHWHTGPAGEQAHHVHTLTHATCTYMQSWIHSAGVQLQLAAEGWYARDTRARGVACSHTIFRVGGVQQRFGDGGLTIRERYALAGASAALYKFPSRWLPAHPALLLSPFCSLQMP